MDLATSKNIKTNIPKKKRLIKFSIIIVCIFIVLLLVTPPIAVLFLTQGHVDYKGYATEEYPLQDIYHASDYELDATELELITEDGYKIWVSEVYAEQPKAVIIYLSGIRQPSVTYFYGHSKWMQKNGYASMLLEVRGHGQSDGDQICMGYQEVADVKAVVDYIKCQQKYDNVPIVLQGVSMGGAVVVNSFGQIPEIDGLIAMSAYSSVEDILCDSLRLYHIPQFICNIEKPLFRACLKLKFGDNADELKPIEQIKNAGDRPVFLIASLDDSSVPSVNTQRLIEHAPDSDIWFRDSSDHFVIQGSDFINMEQDTEYCKKILGFLDSQIAY